MRVNAAALRLFLLVGVIVVTACGVADDGVDEARSPELSDALVARRGEPAVRVVAPEDGATVTAPFVVEVETDNLELSPAGRTKDGEGHFHILVDQECVEAGMVIPTDERSIDVSDGASTETISLPAGRHELCVQIGDGFHVAVAIVDRVTVNVAVPLADSVAAMEHGRRELPRPTVVGVVEGRVVLEG